MTYSDLELMELHRDALFRRDGDGRLRSVNETSWPPAPRLWLGRTAGGNCWGLRYDLAADAVASLERLCRDEPIVADFEAPPHNYAAIKAVLEAHAPIAAEYRGPAFLVPDGLPVRGDVVQITPANAVALEPWFDTWRDWVHDDTRTPLLAVLVDGRAVSLCGCARKTDQACEAGVETAQKFRGHGYAAAAVAGWAAAVRAAGRLPMYSTWWANLGSRRIAAKLGMTMYGEDWSLS